jgi:hypothetical protein
MTSIFDSAMEEGQRRNGETTRSPRLANVVQYKVDYASSDKFRLKVPEEVISLRRVGMPDNVRYRTSNTLCNESIVQTLHNKFDSCNESIVRRCRTSRNFPTSPSIRRCKKLLCATSLLADVVQQVRFCNESSPLGRRCRTSVTLQRVEPVWQTLQNKCDKNRNKIALHQGA